ncbi:restriction endonuclease [Paracoccaceae bacterium]|nr:restriction endonuclease [Paracoccaceae bacterium]
MLGWLFGKKKKKVDPSAIHLTPSNSSTLGPIYSMDWQNKPLAEIELEIERVTALRTRTGLSGAITAEKGLKELREIQTTLLKSEANKRAFEDAQNKQKAQNEQLRLEQERQAQAEAEAEEQLRLEQERLIALEKEAEVAIAREQKAELEKQRRLKKEKRAEADENKRLQREKRAEKKAAREAAVIAKAAKVQHQRDEYLRKAIEKHYVTLKRNFGRVYRKNDYGAVELDDRKKEFIRFLESNKFKICPDESPYARYISHQRLNKEYKKMTLRIAAEQRAAKKAGFDSNDLPKNGLDFERWVANSLEQFGWKTNVSVGSGDQGVDVIAEAGLISVGIQCKLYSGSVGNKAVQEIKAGIEHYNCEYGVVITNAKYTKSAIVLAASTGMFLLKHTDIPDLKNILNIE